MRATDAMIRPLVTVGPRDFARHAEGLMDDFGLTMLPVVDRNVFLGVVTKAGCRHGDDDSVKVEQVMSQPVLTVGPEFDVVTLFDEMTRYEVLCVPVLVDRDVIGMITRLDVLQAISHDDPHLRVGHAAEHS